MSKIKYKFLLSFLIIFLGLLTYGFGINANEIRYVVQSISIIKNFQLKVDDYKDFSQDLSFFKGHYYPVSPPGLTIVALAPTWLAQKIYHSISTDKKEWIFQRGLTESSFLEKNQSNKAFELFFTLNLVRIFLAIPIAVLLGVSTFSLYSFVFKDFPSSTIFFSALIILISTNLFFFIPKFFSNVASSTLIVLFFSSFLKWEKYYLSGFILGFFPLFDYSLCFLFVFILLWSLWSLGLFTLQFLSLLFGTLFGLSIFFCYHYYVFENPFMPATYYWVGGDHPQKGAYGLHLPTLKSILYVLFSLERGFFIYNPIMIFSIIGLFISKNKILKSIQPAIFGTFIVLLFVSAGFLGDLKGGWSWGPRYLIPGITLLGLGLPPILNTKSNFLVYIVATISFILHFFAAIIPVEYFHDSSYSQLVNFIIDGNFELPIIKLFKLFLMKPF